MKPTYEELEAEIARLKEALEIYGNHDMGCRSWSPTKGGKFIRGKCNCGFEDALNPPLKELGEGK